MRDQLILFSVKREFRKLFFVTLDLKVLHDHEEIEFLSILKSSHLPVHLLF